MMNKKSLNITLKPVKRSDCSFLFTLLKERKPNMIISHKKMPTYNQHVKFVMSKPYTKWYVIFYSGKKIGSIYLSKQDEIGLHLMRGIREREIESKAFDLLIKENPRDRYLSNVNPKDKTRMKFLKKKGFTVIQYTYEFVT